MFSHSSTHSKPDSALAPPPEPPTFSAECRVGVSRFCFCHDDEATVISPFHPKLESAVNSDLPECTSVRIRMLRDITGKGGRTEWMLLVWELIFMFV